MIDDDVLQRVETLNAQTKMSNLRVRMQAERELGLMMVDFADDFIEAARTVKDAQRRPGIIRRVLGAVLNRIEEAAAWRRA